MLTPERQIDCGFSKAGKVASSIGSATIGHLGEIRDRMLLSLSLELFPAATRIGVPFLRIR